MKKSTTSQGYSTKIFRLSWLTNSALVYEPKCGGRSWGGGLTNEYNCAHGAQLNFGDLTPYLTYASRCFYTDSHCECSTGWLEPMLDRIAKKNTTVVAPIGTVVDVF
jgi:hypothetical protein